MEERTGEAFELDEQLTVVGRKLQAGDQAPDFRLDGIDPADGSIRPVGLNDSAGTVRLLNVVNSVDTPVCDLETRRWEDLARDLPPGAHIYTVSMDLPYAMSRWQQAAGVGHQMLSAHKDERFGADYGVLIKEWRLLQRAVFVIDDAGRVVHAEYVADQMLQPDYRAAIDSIRQAR
jgi:thioredoxin-dependent peroxiredoxin